MKSEITVYSSYDGENIEIDVRIDYYKVVKGNSWADNPDDFYGYTECEYTILKVTNLDTGEALDELILDIQAKERIREAIDIEMEEI